MTGPLMRDAGRGGNVLLALLVWSATVAAIDISICASFNTALMDKKLDIYQTNGLCHDMCLNNNQAYAITQGNACWCSDYTPAKSKQVDKSECNQPCPAYPSENCGGPGVFGYILLNVSPSGTKGADPEPTPTPTEKAEIPTSTAWVTRIVQDTVIPPPPPPPPSPASSSRTSSPESTEETSTTSTSTSTTKSSTYESLPPATSVIQTVTAGGTIQTVTIIHVQTHPAVSNESNTLPDVHTDKSGLGTGGVVGIVVGVLGLAAMALFLCFQRKRRREGDFQDDPSVRGSLSGMLGGRSEMSGIPGSPGSTGNRSSMLQVDPRMNPFKQGIYARNGSHESIHTLRDDHDYSRRIQQPKVLRAMNPDPTD